MHRHHHFHGGRDEHRGRHPWAGHMGPRGAHGRHRGGRIGRFLEHGDLRFIVLALLAEQPRHGYELIRELEDRTGGAYRPSPGVIYPALTFLEEIGHTSVTQDAARKLYSITEQGKAHLADNRATADTILEALSRIGRRMEEVREAFAGVSDLDGEASDEMHRARHALKSALRQKRGSDAAEARRIAKILERAAAEILQQ